jgi:ADP-ribose pyrophosphatase
MIQPWIIIEERDLSPSEWMPITQHKVQLPNGKIVEDYYYCKLGNVALVIAFTTNNKIVLVRQYKHGIGQIVLELPGGMQHNHADMKACALAELEEETGIRAKEDTVVSLGVMSGNPTKTNQVTYGFLATDVVFNAQQKFDDNEDIELVLVSPQQLLQMVATGEVWVADSVSFILKANVLYPNLFVH